MGGEERRGGASEARSRGAGWRLIRYMAARILLPLDGSGDWESLVPHLDVLAAEPDDEILVLEAVSFTETLFEMPLSLGAGEVGAGDDTDFARKYVAAVAEHLRGQGFRARELVQIGTPTATIAGVARRQQAALIALAVRERSGFPGTLFRTLAEGVLRASPTPIYAVPAVATEEPVSPPARSGDIVVPIDGSGRSLQAISAASVFARRLSGRLVFLHVATEDGGPARAAEEALESALRRAAREGVAAEAQLRRGDPAAEILRFSAERRASLIAMRTRLSLSEEGGPLGSVTVQVLRAARAPMLIVRRGVLRPSDAAAQPEPQRGPGASRGD